MVANIVRFAPKLFNYGARAVKAAPSIIFGNGANTFVNAANVAMKGSTSASLGGTVWNAIKSGGKAVEAGIASKGGIMAICKGTLTKASTKALQGWNVGARAAKIAVASGKAGWFTKLAAKVPLIGKLGGACKGLAKAMPGIGNILMVACSVPTIFSAFKDKGLWGGVKEIAKEGTKLGAGAIGGAIGAPFGPLGAAVGWGLGMLVGGLFTGKSHSEKKAEEEAKQQELAQQQAAAEPQGVAYNPQQGYTYNGNFTGNPYGSYNPWNNDILYQQMGFNQIA